MTPKHAYFEFLCALAELGQLSPSELSEFREHSQLCAACRQRLLELAALHATMVVTNALNDPPHQTPRGMTSRFVAQVAREGIPLNKPTQTIGAAHTLLTSAALLALLIAGIIVGRNRVTPFPAVPQQSNTVNSSVDNRATQAKLSRVAKQPVSNIARSVNLHERRVASQSRRQCFSLQSSNAPSKPLMRTDWAELSYQQTTSHNAPDHTSQGGDTFSAELDFAHTDSFSSSPRYPRFKFFAHRENSGKEPYLLTACLCSPLVSLDSRTSFALTSPAQFFQPDVDAYRRTVKPEFRPDPATFQLIENVHR